MPRTVPRGTSRESATDRNLNSFVGTAGRPGAAPVTTGRVRTNPDDPRELVSLPAGRPLLRTLGDGVRRAGWLLNTEPPVPLTTTHQDKARAAVTGGDLPVVAVAFSCLDAAGIDRASVRPIDCLAPGRRTTVRSAAQREQIPQAHRHTAVRLGSGWLWTERHWEHGTALFEADWHDRSGRTRRAVFLAGHDQAARRTAPRHLWQIPDGATPATLRQAHRLLTPEPVWQAGARGEPVRRHGRLYLLPVTPTAEQVRKAAAEREHDAPVAGTDHRAGQAVRADDGTSWVRGTLTHHPPSGPALPPLPLGGTWHVALPVRVARDEDGQPRAWVAVDRHDT